MEKEKEEYSNILIIGITGGLAHLTTRLLLRKYPNARILGIDARRMDPKKKLDGVEYLKMNYSRNKFEKLFRANNFDLVLHLGRVSHASTNPYSSLRKRLNLNILGTQTVLNLCLNSTVKRVVLLSTYHVYGALAENSVFLKEDSPLKASLNHPDLRDVVEMDRLSTSWMWQHHSKFDMVVLRPCNIIGPNINNAMSKFLRSPYAPIPIDFDPMFQFINEFDMATVLVRSIAELPSGVFNIATDDFISLSNAKKVVGVPGIPIPITLVGLASKLIKKSFPSLPDYLVDYLKFSTLISNTELKKHMGENFWRYSTDEALKMLLIDT